MRKTKIIKPQLIMGYLIKQRKILELLFDLQMEPEGDLDESTGSAHAPFRPKT